MHRHLLTGDTCDGTIIVYLATMSIVCHTYHAGSNTSGFYIPVIMYILRGTHDTIAASHIYISVAIVIGT